MKDTISDLASLIDDTSLYIDAIVTAWYDAEEPPDYETKSWRVWSVTLGTLSRDVGAAAAREGVSGSLRAAEILTRSLFEYYVRLGYYAAFPAKSIAANRDAVEVMRKLTSQVVRDGNLSKMPNDYREWIERQVSVTSQQLRNMLEESLRANQASEEDIRSFIEEFYFGFYYVASFMTHGSQGSLLDVFDGVDAEADDRIWVQLAENRPDTLRVPTLYRLSHMLIRIAQVMEVMLSVREATTATLMQRLTQQRDAMRAAAVAYARGRPPYLARLRTTGM
jgi:hypothetical protein